MSDRLIKTLIEDPENPGNLILDLGTELCEQLGWETGDSINWHDNGDGTWTLSKAEDQNVDKST